MWNDLVNLGISVPEKIVRTVLVYLVLAILLRVVGKRDLAQLNPFDLLVMLLLSNVVQNAIIGNDNSVLGGAIGAATLVLLNAGVVRVVRQFNAVARVVEGHETILARDGEWDHAALLRIGLREADVNAALKRQNANKVSETEKVTLAPGGAFVVKMQEDEEAASVKDIRRIEAKLDLLLAARG